MPAPPAHVSPYSGSWYPSDPHDLAKLLDDLFEESEGRTGRYLAQGGVGFVVPHAGIAYSGAVAAAVYRHLAADGANCVVLLGFSHRGAKPGAWIADIDAVRTPLGEVSVDCQMRSALLEGGAFQTLPEAALCDHSVEIQLPLLQRAAPGARIVPVYVSALDGEARTAAARRLGSLMRPGVAVVASSDFTHYGRSFQYEPFPADGWVSERLRELDESVMEAAGSLSPAVFLEKLRETGATVCGYEPISLLLETLRLRGGCEVFQEALDYRTSGELTGEFRQSVSYSALGYFPESAFRLEREEQTLLMGSARSTLGHYLETGERKPIPPARIPPALERRAGAFVTLHKQGELRGCIGRRAAREPLWQTVPAMTLAAALEDNRFRPVRKGDEGIEVEISVLSPFKLLSGLDEFRVNEHGALLEAGTQQGLLLPQVATERGWSARQFLDALARKSGVGSGVYSDPHTRVFVFRAQVIE